MKRVGLFLGAILFLVVVVLAGAVVWWRWAAAPVGVSGKDVDFVIKKGESIEAIGKRLEQNGVIRNALAFRLTVWQQGLSNRIQAGRFKLNSGLGVAETVKILMKGTEDVWITLPEGWRKEEVAARLAANLPKFNKSNFLLKAPEGYLFPDTYLVPQEANEDLILRLFADNFAQKFTFISETLTEKQILTLASLVEREAKAAVDRPIIAGILAKRLKSGWPLQVDATVQYAKGGSGEWWPTVYKEDLKIKSPYNTYLNKGLPPGPICNPGLASIKAVITPQATEYWYYLTGTDGLMHYAATSADHQQNIQKYL